MTGEPTHTAPKERNGTVHPSYINYCLKSEVSIMLHCQLRMFNLLHNITNQELFEECLCNPHIPHLQKKEMAPCAPVISIIIWTGLLWLHWCMPSPRLHVAGDQVTTGSGIFYILQCFSYMFMTPCIHRL